MKFLSKYIFLILSFLPLIISAQDKIADLLPYIEKKLDVKLKEVVSKKGGVEVIETGPNNRITGNWPGPKKWTITYAGPSEKRSEATEIHKMDDLLRVLVSLREQNKTTAYFALQRNGSLPKIFHADISDFEFGKITKTENGEKNSLVNLAAGGIIPVKLRNGDSNCIAIIGRDMCRVNFYVKQLQEKYKDKNTHIETWNENAEEKYKYDKNKSQDENVNNDGDWLCEKIKKGCTIIDIGCDEKYKCDERIEKPYYDCSVSSPYYQREQLIAFGSYDCYKPYSTNVTATNVTPTDVKPTDVNSKKNFKPFSKADGTLKPVDFYFGGGVAVKNSYAEGKALHDFIYRYASAAGQGGGTGGSFGYFNAYSGFMIPINKKRSSFLGGELQFAPTFHNAIIAFSTYGGYEIFLRSKMVNACFTAGLGLDPLGKFSLVAEPGIIVGLMKGELAFAPNYERIDESGAVGLGFNMAGGLNVRFTRTKGIRLRAGQRLLKITERHKADATGNTTYFVNGTDGEKLIVDWSGFFGIVSFDLYF